MNAKKRSYHTMRDFLFVVFKHKVLAASFMLLLVLAAAAACLLIPPTYEACAKLLVKDPAGQSPGLAETEKTGYPPHLTRQALIDTAVEILTGRYLAEKVITALGSGTLYPGLQGNHAAERTLTRFQESLAVRGGTIIEVTFQHHDAAQAAKVVNLLLEEFVEHYRAVQKQDEQYRFFKKQVELISQRLQQSQQELGLFRNQHNISSIQKQKSLLLLQISDLEVELAKTRAAVSEQESIAENLKASSEDALQIQHRIISLKSKEKKLSQHITQYRLELGRLDKAETRLSELERQVRMDEENYLLYTKKMEEARISNAMDEQKLISFSIIEPALQPLTAIKPDRPLIILAAVVLGCVGGLLLAFVSEYFTHSFDNGEDIEQILGCSTAATFPELTGQAAGRLRALHVPEQMLAPCNRIKHTLLRALPGASNRTILFCSSQAGEGTSTVLLSFALSLAAEGESVLVIDAHLDSPCLHEKLSLDRAPGLLEAVREHLPADAVIQRTRIANLAAVACGAPQPNPFALVDSEHFDSLLQELKARASWIIFDTAPVNSFTNAGMLASRVDGIVLVVKAGKTRWEAALSACNRLKQAHAKIRGAVLNRQPLYIPGWIYRLL